LHGDNVAPALAASEALRPKTSEKNEFKRKSTPAIHPMTSEGGAERRRSLALAVILSGVAAVAIGWIATPPAARNEAIGFIAQNTKGTNKPLEPKNDLSAHETTDVPLPRSENNGPQAHGFDQVPADRPLNGSERHLEPVRPQVRNLERPAARPAVNSAVRRAESTLPKSDPAKPPEHAAVAVPNPAGENVRSQVVEASPAQPTESTATPATSLSENIPTGTAAAEVKEKESPPPALKQPNAPVSPTWSVAVSTDPYPSIRIPEDISSQKPSIVRSLQIGRAISRVEPVYPEDAKRQGIEGTVKLHVVVGGDGSVESVELASGPALLAKAATSAIREWHYGQTLLGGQPVETEQDVVVKFRLAGPSNSKN
jgi:TonB family protein